MASMEGGGCSKCRGRGSEPGLAGYWNFNEGTGTTASDATAGGNHGSSGTARNTITVTNVAPTAAISGVPASSPEGSPITLTGVFADAGKADSLTLTWAVTLGVTTVATGSGPTFTFTPDDDGT